MIINRYMQMFSIFMCISLGTVSVCAIPHGIQSAGRGILCIGGGAVIGCYVGRWLGQPMIGCIVGAIAGDTIEKWYCGGKEGLHPVRAIISEELFALYGGLYRADRNNPYVPPVPAPLLAPVLPPPC